MEAFLRVAVLVMMSLHNNRNSKMAESGKELNSIVLSETSQTQKDRHCVFSSCVRNLDLNININLYIA